MIPPPASAFRRWDLIAPPVFLAALVAIVFVSLTLILLPPEIYQRFAELSDQSTIATNRNPGLSAPAGLTASTDSDGLLSTLIRPQGASVYVDDVFVGEDPLIDYPVEAGYHWITVRAEGHQVLDTLVYIDSDAPLILRARLATEAPGAESNAGPVPGLRESQPASTRIAGASESPAARPASPALSAELFVLVQPRDAEILIDGEPLPRARFMQATLEPGTYFVTARHAGFESTSRRVELAPGESRTLEISLVPAAVGDGQLAVTVRPWGTIYIDGDLIVSNTDVQFTATVAAGTRRVRAEHPSLGSREVSVDVRPGATTAIVIDLLP